MLPFRSSFALFPVEFSPATHCRPIVQGRPSSESRKLAAIFAADVVGFSRLAGAGVRTKAGSARFATEARRWS
jgi:hypothetical protein